MFIINASSSLFNNKYYLLASLFMMYFTLTFSLKSGWGTGVPHFKSLVMQRGLSPSLSHERVICLAFAVQSPASVDLFSHCSNWVSSCIVGNKENKYSNENNQMSYPLPTPDSVTPWIIQHFTPSRSLPLAGPGRDVWRSGWLGSACTPYTGVPVEISGHQWWSTCVDLIQHILFNIMNSKNSKNVKCLNAFIYLYWFWPLFKRSLLINTHTKHLCRVIVTFYNISCITPVK